MTVRPCLVGLTGGLASGKSTVAGLLRDLGVPVLDADAVVHDLYRSGRVGARRVAELFGETVLAEDGSVDRARLARRVLDDDEARRRLEAVIHPLVRDTVDAWVTDLEAPVGVVEAALLVETGSWRRYDILIVVRCRPDQQLKRAVARGLEPERARALLAAQMPIDEKVAAADIVVDNSGNLSDLDEMLRAAWAEVIERCRHCRETEGG